MPGESRTIRVTTRLLSTSGIQQEHSQVEEWSALAALLLNQLEDAPISLVWLFEHSGHLPGLGGLRDSLSSYLCYLLLAVNCRCNYQLLKLELFWILLECTHCHYNELLLSCRVVFAAFCAACFYAAFTADWLTVTMSCVSAFQCLDLCIAFHCIAVTPLRLPELVSQ